MKNESQAMKELHEIREKNCEATKNMTNSELIEYTRKKANKAEIRIKELREVKV
jgi:hypothetical protein